MTLKQYLSNIREVDGSAGVKEVQEIYREVKTDFSRVGVRNSRFLNHITLTRTQAIYSGLVDEEIFDVKALKTAKRLQNFSIKYGYSFIDRFLTEQIDYNGLKEEIADFKRRNEQYLKEQYQ